MSFGSTPVGSTSTEQALTFGLPSGGTLGFTPFVVLTQGALNLDFKASASQSANVCASGRTYIQGDSCTVTITFNPTRPGQRLGAVQLMGSDGTPIFTTPVSGIGTGALVTFVSKQPSLTLGSNFTAPLALAVDGKGDVFVGDISNNSVVKEILAVNGSVSTSSAVATIASGFSSPDHLAVDGSGNVFVADATDNAVKEIVAVNGVVSPSSAVVTVGSGFILPIGVAVDGGGNVFVADTGNNAVKEILALNGVVTASSPVMTVGSGFKSPYGLAVDGSGNVFVADTANSAVKEILAVNGSVSVSSVVNTVGEGFNKPTTVAVDPVGNVYVSDMGNGDVQEIIAVNGTVGSQSAVVTIENVFGGVALDANGNVFVTDVNAAAVRELNLADPPSLTFASTAIGSVSSDSPQTVFVENAGNAPLTGSLAISTGPFGDVQSSGLPLDCAANFSFAPGGGCYLSMSFAPTGIGSFTGNIILTDNNSTSATQTISLSGTGFAPSQTITISNVLAAAVGGDSEVITWTTNQPSTTQLNYGGGTNFGLSTPLDTALVTSHSATITGLAANSSQYYQAVSTNPTNGAASSPAAFFTVAPYVGYLAFWGVNNSGVTISWSTSVPANTFVQYGTTTALGQESPIQSALISSHGVILTGLNGGTTYYFRALSATPDGNTGASTIYSFTTTGFSNSVAPVISTIRVGNISATSATVTWTTDQPSTSLVSYGITTSYGLTALDSNLVTAHSVTLSNLMPGTAYNCDVSSSNATGTATGTSVNVTFTTSTGVTSTAPVISNIVAAAVTSTSATITWTTDQPSSSQVNFGTAVPYSASSVLNTSLVTSHSVTLSGLTAATLYNFDVVSENAVSLINTSGNGTFETIASTATPPYVGYIADWGINNAGITISWSTDVPANTQLAYGTSPSLGQLTSLQTALTSSHGVVLTGLNSGTKYYFVAQSTGTNGATGYSSVYTFTTTGTASQPPPLISNVMATPSQNGAIITWTTDQASTSQVSYGTSLAYSQLSAVNNVLATSHSVTLNGLSPGTTYNFAAVSANSSNLTATSANSTFTTITVSAIVPVVSYVAFWGVTSSGVNISWSTNVPANTSVEYGTATNALVQTSPLQTALATSHGVVLTNLTPDTTYYFVAQSSDASGNAGSSTTYRFTTIAGAPTISNVVVTPIANNTANISWTTSAPAYSYVQYGATSRSYNRYSAQTALSANPDCTLSYVPSGTIYYQLISTDANGNQVTSPEMTFSEP